jgi:bacterioferritin (cytochrome b1)
MDKTAVLKTLNRIMEFELAGVVRYTHYALMVYGYNRIRSSRGCRRRRPRASTTRARPANW